MNRHWDVTVWSALVLGLGTATIASPLAGQDRKPCPPAERPAGTPLPFRVTVDGEPRVRGDVMHDEDRTRCEDSALERANIQVRADLRERTPVLNLTAPRSALRNQPVIFTGYSNYAAWIARSELRILPAEGSTGAPPLAITASTDPNSLQFRWTVQLPESIEQVRYVLRVYDREGQFDETAPKTLAIVDRLRTESDRESDERESLVGYGENHRSVINIPVVGAAITVNGDQFDAKARVSVFGRTVPVAENGRFATREIMPIGTHTVTITVEQDGARHELTRTVELPRRDWFHLAVADFTLGKNSVTGPAALVTGQDTRRYRGQQYLDGRLGFYLKGDLGSETVLTASADTREQPIEDLFSNFGARDPMALLRRLDVNYSYPVYGDDGVLIDDAPTQGKFHVRLERHDSHLMWGSFQTPVTGTDLVRFNRGLYGGELQLRALGSTQFGERRTRANVFAADPGTAGARDEFRATGGSLYYLRNQDVLLGSEQVMVEVRDRESGLILESTTLVPTQDYELNALQGRVVLRAPLSSIAESHGLVRTGALSGNPVYLVVAYEHTPMGIRLDNFTTGGRVAQWVGDHVQLGLTGYKQDGLELGQELLAGDVTLRYRPGTFVTVERARSEGRGTQAMRSIDGGFAFTPIASSATAASKANASRVEVGMDLAELSDGTSRGHVGLYWQDRGNGFSAPGQLSTEATRQGGGQLSIPLSDQVAVSAKADLREGDLSGSARSLEFGTDLGLSRNVLLQGGVRHERRETGLLGGSSALLSEVGQRTDLIGVLGYQPVDSLGAPRGYSVYGLLQGTVSRDDSRSTNDRYGVGGRLRLSDRVALSTEVTDGSGGMGGKVESEFQVSDRTSLYLNYLMDTDRADQGYRGRTGNLSAGGRVRYSEAVSLFAERRQQSSEAGPSGLIHAFGLDLAPSDRWSWGLKLEGGTIADPNYGDVDRKAASIFAGYATERLRWGGALEYRTEKTDQVAKRVSWLSRNNVGVQLSDGWRALGRANVAVSTGPAGTSGLDADYTELVAGLAYRPVRNNRVNALFRYTYLYDLTSPDQLGPRLEINPYAQRSHVLSVDAIARAARWISIGGKVGHRRGEIRDRSSDIAPWTASSAWLAIARGDLHVVKQWDVVGELRRLSVTEASDARSGVLLGVYRQVGTNLRVGLGYNFTDYSDDLTDLRYRSRGWFLNLLGVL